MSKRRRSALALHKKRTPKGDQVFEQLCRAIQQAKLIPIIGETIRIGHIFDVNMDQNIGIEEVDEEVDEEDELIGELNVIEELAYRWADEIEYPLTDRFRIGRVAQFCTVDQENSTLAKEDYLAFLKRTLLDVAAEIADNEGDEEGAEFVEQLRMEHSYTFADVVKELDYPLFSDDKPDPLRILAKLPLKIYVTTGHYNFIERALIAEGKQPRSQICFWNLKPENVQPEHRFDPSYEPDVANPVVYHLFGMERYPASLVLSEDDYLDFLWQLARDLPGDSGERIIPPYLEAELNASSLLLLGYRLQDWDFRILFRGLLNANREASSRRGVSVAIQINPDEQPLVDDEAKAKIYLNRYFQEAKFRVHWDKSDDFIIKLWREWREYNEGSAT